MKITKKLLDDETTEIESGIWFFFADSIMELLSKFKTILEKPFIQQNDDRL